MAGCDSIARCSIVTSVSSAQVTDRCSSTVVKTRDTSAVSISVSSRGLVVLADTVLPSSRSTRRSIRLSSALMSTWVPSGLHSITQNTDGWGIWLIADDQVSWSMPSTSISTGASSSVPRRVASVRQHASCARSSRRSWSIANLLGREKSMSRTRGARRFGVAGSSAGTLPARAASTSAAT